MILQRKTEWTATPDEVAMAVGRRVADKAVVVAVAVSGPRTRTPSRAENPPARTKEGGEALVGAVPEDPDVAVVAGPEAVEASVAAAEPAVGQ